MEIIFYLMVGVFSSTITYHLAKKRSKSIISGLEKTIEFNNKIFSEELDRKNDLIRYQKEILWEISDSVHNIGSTSDQKKLDYNKKEFKKNVGSFFSSTRVLTENLVKECYNKDELIKILEFMKNDLGSYCHYSTKDLDLNKYRSLIIKD